MYTLLMVLFIILCFFLAILVLLQQGKGDLGIGSMAGNQMLFGGSGGQGFFEKTTWVMGMLFMLGALGLTVVKSRESNQSVLQGAKPSKRSLPVAAAQADPAEETNNNA
jgi:preprotein translocase subunit SecG